MLTTKSDLHQMNEWMKANIFIAVLLNRRCLYTISPITADHATRVHGPQEIVVYMSNILAHAQFTTHVLPISGAEPRLTEGIDRCLQRGNLDLKLLTITLLQSLCIDQTGALHFKDLLSRRELLVKAGILATLVRELDSQADVKPDLCTDKNHQFKCSLLECIGFFAQKNPVRPPAIFFF